MLRCLLILVLLQVAVSQDVEVETEYGTVVGHVVTFGDGTTQVVSFLGVPFAKAPNETLRFMHPQPPDPWEEPFVADRLRAACPQGMGNIGITHPLWDQFSEDCLHLNIYTPHEHEEPGPYPVMLFFHGGVFRSSANIQYPGHFYAARGVIMIAANYRLGNLGFAGTGDPAFPGNQGMMDQVAAMDFVQRNIAAFGGDPNQVTIFGQSAGGASVGHHLVSPRSAGKFHRAILQSGTDMVIWSHNHNVMARNLTRQIAIRNNCSTESSAAMAECLKALPEEQVRRTRTDRFLGNFTLGPVPMIDNPDGFLPDSPLALREAGNFNKVPIMAGVTSNEFGPVFIDIEDGLNYTDLELAIEGVANFFLFHYDDQTTADVRQAMLFEYTDWPYLDDVIRNRDALNSLANDLAFVEGMDQTMNSQTRFNTTYQYNFGYRSDLLDLVLPEWTGLFHAADVPWIFGHPLIGDHPEIIDDTQMEIMAIIPFTEMDQDVARYWITLLSNYGKTGNPTPEPVPVPPQLPPETPPTDWKPWSLQDTNLLNITKTSISQRNQWRQRTKAMWREYIPWMMSRRYAGPGDARLPPTAVLDQFMPEGEDNLAVILENVMLGIPVDLADAELVEEYFHFEE